MNKKIIVLFVTLMVSVGLISCGEKKPKEPITRTELFMGTSIKVTIYDKSDEKILDEAFKRIIEIEDLVSINKDGTEITELNKNAGIKGVKLSDDSFNIVKKGLMYSEISNGGYDLTIGPLVKLWSIGLPEAKVPNDKEIKDVIGKIDYKKVEVNEESKEVFLKEKGMMLDLGSIAKGYAADEIAKLLKEKGVKEAIVDLGGNIYALGLKEGDKEWKVGIQDPFTDRGNVVGSVQVSNKSVVTTGIYERFLEKNGVKYHHILNPKDGKPYKTELAGVSIIADESVDADGLSTLVFTKGLDEGLKFIESLDGIDAVFITENREVYTTDGIKDNFKMMNESFKLSN